MKKFLAVVEVIKGMLINKVLPTTYNMVKEHLVATHRCNHHKNIVLILFALFIEGSKERKEEK